MAEQAKDRSLKHAAEAGVGLLKPSTKGSEKTLPEKPVGDTQAWKHRAQLPRAGWKSKQHAIWQHVPTSHMLVGFRMVKPKHTHIYTYIHKHTYTHALHYITLHYITLHYITSHCITSHHIILQYITYIALHAYMHTYIHYITYTTSHRIASHRIARITSHHITSHHIHTRIHT